MKYILNIILILSCCIVFSQTYTYDDLNRLTEVDYGNGTKIEYTYDLLGNHTQRMVTGDCIDFSTNGGEYIQDFEVLFHHFLNQVLLVLL